VDVLDWILIPGAELGSMVIGVSRLGMPTTQGWWWRDRAELPLPRSQAGVLNTTRIWLAGKYPKCSKM
jgi:hypothetical protein